MRFKNKVTERSRARRTGPYAALLLALATLVGCASGAGRPAAGVGGSSGAVAAPPSASGPQRATAAIRGEARNLSVVASLPGGPEVRELMQSGLGEVVPSIENGLWVVFPDGSMQLRRFTKLTRVVLEG